MTVGMYARRKEWPLEDLVVHLTYAKVHAADCLAAGDEGEEVVEAPGVPHDDPDALVDCIQREIELLGPLDDAQRERLLHIANRCPVHRTLTEGGIVVHSRLAEPGSLTKKPHDPGPRP